MGDEMGFEEALKKLEDIVNSLETGNLSLDESLARFEEGIKLSRLCNRRLMDAQQRVEKLVERGNELVAEPVMDE